MKATRKHSKTTIRNAAFIRLILIIFFQSMSQQMMKAIAPIYMYDFGANAQVIGISVGAFAMTVILVRPIIGPACDAFSKTVILVISLSLITVLPFSCSCTA